MEGGGTGAEGMSEDQLEPMQEPEDENVPHGNDGAAHSEADGYWMILEREFADDNGLREGKYQEGILDFWKTEKW